MMTPDKQCIIVERSSGNRVITRARRTTHTKQLAHVLDSLVPIIPPQPRGDEPHGHHVKRPVVLAGELVRDVVLVQGDVGGPLLSGGELRGRDVEAVELGRLGGQGGGQVEEEDGCAGGDVGDAEGLVLCVGGSGGGGGGGGGGGFGEGDGWVDDAAREVFEPLVLVNQPGRYERESVMSCSTSAAHMRLHVEQLPTYTKQVQGVAEDIGRRLPYTDLVQTHLADSFASLLRRYFDSDMASDLDLDLAQWLDQQHGKYSMGNNYVISRVAVNKLHSTSHPPSASVE
jgi:hypothetical protein